MTSDEKAKSRKRGIWFIVGSIILPIVFGKDPGLAILSHFILNVLGCYNVGISKGYSGLPSAGLLGMLSLFGALVVLLLPDKDSKKADTAKSPKNLEKLRQRGYWFITASMVILFFLVVTYRTNQSPGGLIFIHLSLLMYGCYCVGTSKKHGAEMALLGLFSLPGAIIALYMKEKGASVSKPDEKSKPEPKLVSTGYKWTAAGVIAPFVSIPFIMNSTYDSYLFLLAHFGPNFVGTYYLVMGRGFNRTHLLWGLLGCFGNFALLVLPDDVKTPKFVNKFIDLLKSESPERRFERISRLVAKKKYSKAISQIQAFLAALTADKPESPNRAKYLGLVYLLKARAEQESGLEADALKSFMAARSHIPLPFPALSFTANRFVNVSDNSDAAVDVYLDYLKAKKDTPDLFGQDSVGLQLRLLCTVDEDCTPESSRGPRVILERLSEEFNEHDWIFYSLGLALGSQGAYASAAIQMDRAGALNPKLHQAPYFASLYRGIICIQGGGHDKALDYFNSALEWLEIRPEAYFHIASTLIAKCEEIELDDSAAAINQTQRLAGGALENIQTADRIKPGKAAYLYIQGRAHFYLDDIFAAKDCLVKAVNLDARLEHQVHAAKAYYRLGDYKSAELMTGAATQESTELYQIKGDIFTAQNQFSKAYEAYNRALSINKDYLPACIGLGKAYLSAKDYPNGIRILKPIGDKSRLAAFFLSRCYSLADNFQEAIPVLRALCASPAAKSDYWYYLGCAFANKGDYPEAAVAFESCVSLEPNRSLAYVQLGHCRLKMNRGTEAMEAYRAVFIHAQDNKEANLAIAAQHLRESKTDEANVLLEALQKDHPQDYQIKLMRGIAFEKDGDTLRAEDAYSHAVDIDSSRPEIHVRLGIMLRKNGKNREAVSALEEAVIKKHETDSALFNLGLACAEQQNPKAIEHWETLFKKHPEDEQLKRNVAMMHYGLGGAEFVNERYEFAAEAWEKAMNLVPDDDGLRHDLAEAKFRAGVMRAASKDTYAKTILSSSTLSDHPFAKYYSALDHLIQNNQRSAIQMLEPFLNGSRPDLQVRALYHKGVGYLIDRDFAGAAQALEKVIAHPRHVELQTPVKTALAVAYAGLNKWDQALRVMNY
jgi:tetratricopeptide (TPR) repeat protein